MICVLTFFVKVPQIDGQLTGLNIESTKYYQSGKKIAAFFHITEFIEIKITPGKEDADLIFSSLNQLEENLVASFEKLKVKSIHQAKSLYDGDLDNNKRFDSILEKAVRTPIVQDLISKDHRSFLFIVEFESKDNFNLSKFDSIVSLDYEGIESLKCMSTMHVEDQIEKSLKRDVALISFIIIVLFAVLILFLFRDARAVLYTSIIIIISILPTFFILSVLSIQLNLVTALAIPIILVLSLADAIHLLTGYYSSQESSKEKRILESMKLYIVPSFLTSLTTLIAFASFLLNSAENIQNFGLVISLSVMPSFLLTYMISPYLLRFIAEKSLPEIGVKTVLLVLRKYRKEVSYLLLLLSLVSMFLVSQLSFETDFDSFIPKNTEVAKNRKELSNDFDSQLSINILIEKDAASLKKSNKEFEKDILSMVDQLEQISTIGTIKSIKNQIEFKEKYGDFGQFIIFPNKNNPYRSADKQTHRIEVRLNEVNSLQKTKEKLDLLLNDYESDYNFTIFSKALLIDEVNKQVAQSLLHSLIFSFLFIFLSILILTRSLMVTLISLFVNIVPLSIIVIIFYFGNLDLNILTAITTVVCIGIIVDDTIHIIYRKKILKKDNEELGFGVMTTSIILVCGFLTLIISSFEPCQIFGYVSAIVFLVTMVADLTILPYLMDRFETKN
jgi:predicted RND superfamily exporter protein